MSAHSSVLAALRRVGEATTAAVALAREDLWALYALSSVMELLILPGQPPAIDPGDPADWLASSTYGRFVAAVGGTFPQGEGFHPFLHEIVEVEPADDPQALVGAGRAVVAGLSGRVAAAQAWRREGSLWCASKAALRAPVRLVCGRWPLLLDKRGGEQVIELGQPRRPLRGGQGACLGHP
jgi:hypothetical protein